MVIEQCGKALVNVVAEGYFVEICACDGIFGLDPRSGSGRCIIFKRTVWVGHRYSEICVDSIVARSHRIFQRLSI